MGVVVVVFVWKRTTVGWAQFGRVDPTGRGVVMGGVVHRVRVCDTGALCRRAATLTRTADLLAFRVKLSSSSGSSLKSNAHVPFEAYQALRRTKFVVAIIALLPWYFCLSRRLKGANAQREFVEVVWHKSTRWWFLQF